MSMQTDKPNDSFFEDLIEAAGKIAYIAGVLIGLISSLFTKGK